MVIGLVCAALLVVGLAAGVAWGGIPLLSDEVRAGTTDSAVLSPAEVARRFAGWLNVAVVSGIGAGLLVAGAGGRLVMRLLAVTAGASAQGATTEADQIVGKITLEGTLGFVVFTGLFFGLATGVAYLLIARWLPGGRWSGVVYGLLLLVVFGAVLEPLRANNPDFDLVGPGWVAVLAFGALVVVHGMVVAAMASRVHRALPPLAGGRKLLAYAPLLLVVPVFSIAIVIAVVGGIGVAASRVPSIVALVRSSQFRLGGRLLLALGTAASLPRFATAAVDIVTR